ncbi:transferase, partial [Streptomyces sp. NPDC003233]
HASGVLGRSLPHPLDQLLGAHTDQPVTLGAALWTLGTAEFALARILPGPRTAREIAGMLGTSVVIPPLAVRHWLRGVVRHRHAEPLGGAG